jgi:hypothetical protein
MRSETIESAMNIKKSNLKKFVTVLGAGALATAGLVGVSLASAAPAQAMVCGYSTQIEDAESAFAINLPIIGAVDPFGGERQVAHYGNCSDGHVQITVTTSDGNSSYCVPPGDTRLGFTENDRMISNAYMTSTC